MKTVKIDIVHKEKSYPLVLKVSENMTFMELVEENFHSLDYSNFRVDIDRPLKEIGNVNDIFSQPISSSELKSYPLLHLLTESEEDEDWDQAEEILDQEPECLKSNFKKLHFLMKNSAIAFDKEEQKEFIEDVNIQFTDFLKFSRYSTSRGTALHIRAAYNHDLKPLFDLNAKFNIYDADGLQPFHVATIRGNGESMAQLLEYKATVNDLTLDGKTPLMLAITSAKNPMLVADFLIRKRADLQAPDKEGWGALHYAAKKEDGILCRLLDQKIEFKPLESINYFVFLNLILSPLGIKDLLKIISSYVLSEKEYCEHFIILRKITELNGIGKNLPFDDAATEMLKMFLRCSLDKAATYDHNINGDLIATINKRDYNASECLRNNPDFRKIQFSDTDLDQCMKFMEEDPGFKCYHDFFPQAVEKAKKAEINELHPAGKTAISNYTCSIYHTPLNIFFITHGQKADLIMVPSFWVSSTLISEQISRLPFKQEDTIVCRCLEGEEDSTFEKKISAKEDKRIVDALQSGKILYQCALFSSKRVTKPLEEDAINPEDSIFPNPNIVIKVINKGSGKDVSKLSFFPGEQEVLFPNGTQFRPLKKWVKGNRTIYLMETVEADESIEMDF